MKISDKRDKEFYIILAIGLVCGILSYNGLRFLGIVGALLFVRGLYVTFDEDIRRLEQTGRARVSLVTGLLLNIWTLFL